MGGGFYLMGVRGVSVTFDLFQMHLDCSLIKLVCLALDDADRILGTIPQTGPQAVAEVVSGEHGLPVLDPDSPLGAGRDTKPATVALLFVNLHYLSYHLPVLSRKS